LHNAHSLRPPPLQMGKPRPHITVVCVRACNEFTDRETLLDTSEKTELVCASCGAVNRLPANRLDERPHCGRCQEPLFSGKPIALDAAAFDRFLQRDGLPLLVDFWAPWCGPCKTMAPEFERAAAQLEPRFRLLKVNTEEAQALAGRYAIRSIPTLALFVAGREVARQPGAMGAADIERWALKQLPG